MSLPEHVTAYKDRHGKTRYRFRRAGFVRSLPGEPGHIRFQTAYEEALKGKAGSGRGRRHEPFHPRTMGAAWAELRRMAEWHALKTSSQTVQTSVAERFLQTPIVEGSKITFAQMPFEGLRRGDVKKIIGRYADRKHAGEAVLRLLRKLCGVALDLEWIENDPTYRVRYRPALIGHRSWTDAELRQFEEKWPVGTPQRLGYALALYTGQRRSDLARMSWQAYTDGGIAVLQDKTGAPLWIPAHPELRAILDPMARDGPAITLTAFGKPFSRNGFGNMIADAIVKAKLPDDCRLHGLRKSAGRCLAEAGATSRQIMAILGHKTLAEAERYTREADQKRLAREGIDHWARPRLAVVNGKNATGTDG